VHAMALASSTDNGDIGILGKIRRYFERRDGNLKRLVAAGEVPLSSAARAANMRISPNALH